LIWGFLESGSEPSNARPRSTDRGFPRRLSLSQTKVRVGYVLPAGPQIYVGAGARSVNSRDFPGGAAGKTIAPTLVEIGKNVFLRIGRDNLILVAAGAAFYAMTAIFPAIAAFVFRLWAVGRSTRH
jgi:hypothetical protein